MIDHCLPSRGIGLVGVAKTLRATGGIGVSPGQQPLHARRGRIIRDVEEKIPDGLLKGPPPPPPDFGAVVERIVKGIPGEPGQVDVFRGFQPQPANITFRGLKNIGVLKAREEALLRIKEAEEDDIEAVALILSELD